MAIDIGAELRAAREAKGLSVATLAHRIRVQPRTLAAIELNDLSNLPPRPFVRGFVKAYAEEVDLDPHRTVQSFFAQFPSQPVPVPPTARRQAADALLGPPSQWAGLGTAAAILIIVVTAAVVLGRRGDPEGESNVVGTTGASAPAASVPAAAPATTPAPSAVPAAAPPPPPPLRLAFSVTRPCWVTATSDGQRTLYRTLETGEQQSLDASRQIAIRFGDAGAVKWTINGREGPPLGPTGAVGISSSPRRTPRRSGSLNKSPGGQEVFWS